MTTKNDVSEVTFELPHISLKGLRGGTPGGPFLLLLHGWLDNCRSFEPMFPYLDAYDWVAVDFPGHGYSAHRPVGSAYYFVDWVADIEALIRTQKWQNIHLVGHSMGGYVAQTLAAVFPQPIKKLVTLEAFGMVVSPASDSLQQLRKGLQARLKQGKRRDPVYADINSLVKARAEISEFSEDLALLLLQRNLQPVEGGYRWRTDPRVRAPSPFRFCAQQIPPILQGIEAPMHVILGDQGHNDLPEAVEKWATDVRRISFETLPGGHHFHMQNPASVVNALTCQFIEQV